MLAAGLVLAQELEVDGNLKVTGTVESATIDSMQQVIDGLQVQINAMQVENQLETRVYEFPINLEHDESMPFDINEITGLDLTNPIIYIKSIDNLVVTPGNNGNAGSLQLVNLKNKTLYYC